MIRVHSADTTVLTSVNNTAQPDPHVDCLLHNYLFFHLFNFSTHASFILPFSVCLRAFLFCFTRLGTKSSLHTLIFKGLYKKEALLDVVYFKR